MKQKSIVLLAAALVISVFSFSQQTRDYKDVSKKTASSSASDALKPLYGSISGKIKYDTPSEQYPDIPQSYTLQVFEVKTAPPVPPRPGEILIAPPPDLIVVGQLSDVEVALDYSTFLYSIKHIPINKKVIVVLVCRYTAVSPQVVKDWEKKYLIAGAFFKADKYPNACVLAPTQAGPNINHDIAITQNIPPK